MKKIHYTPAKSIDKGLSPQSAHAETRPADLNKNFSVLGRTLNIHEARSSKGGLMHLRILSCHTIIDP